MVQGFLLQGKVIVILPPATPAAQKAITSYINRNRNQQNQRCNDTEMIKHAHRVVMVPAAAALLLMLSRMMASVLVVFKQSFPESFAKGSSVRSPSEKYIGSSTQSEVHQSEVHRVKCIESSA